MSRLPPVPVFRPAWRRALAGALLAATLGAQAAGSCADEGSQQGLPAEAAQPAPAAEPRLALQALVREALARSQAIGAAALLAEAAPRWVDARPPGALKPGPACYLPDGTLPSTPLT